MDSTVSSGPSAALKTGARAAAEGAVVAAFVGAVLVRCFPEPMTALGLVVGVAAAWLASSASVIWLLWAKARGTEAFWWAFGGGMALRATTLVVLAAWGYGNEFVSLNALLISYVFALLALLLSLEFRYLRVK